MPSFIDKLALNIGSYGFQIVTLWIFLHRWTESHFPCICPVILSLQQCCSETGKKLLIIISSILIIIINILLLMTSSKDTVN